MLNGKSILVTGGTGSFGRKFIEIILKRYAPERIAVFSRDEFKQFEMMQIFSDRDYPNIRYFLGDIRDKERLCRAFTGVDYVIHAAALKQVPALEYNPFEAIKTNILGAQNIVEAALECGVKKVVALSTDKAVSPVNLYGATKLAMEKLFIAANAYTGESDIKFSVVRYGNVLGSRGSVVPYFKKLIANGAHELPVTDDRMTRFFIALEQGVELVLHALAESAGGEIFVPKIPSVKIVDLVAAMSPNCRPRIVGIRPGEKIHETLISEDEVRNTIDAGLCYIILPQYDFETKNGKKYLNSNKYHRSSAYASDTNDEWMSVEQIRTMIKDIEVR